MKFDVKEDIYSEDSSNESGSEDDEEAWKLTEEVEKEFFKTLSQIKSKDPKIYEKDVKFFKNVPALEHKPKQKSTAPLTLQEYERKIVVEKGGELSDEEKPVKSIPSLSYVEEQNALKNSLKNLVQSDSENESEAEWGGLFKKRDKSKTENDKEEDDYKEWLKGQKSEVPDPEVANEMKPLRDFWTNPKLKEDDKFLRDYILNKRFLEENDNEDTKLDHESEAEDLSDKECNHRTEEPNHEYIKRYPRTMQNTVRRKDDSRKRKREEIKERKLKDKQRKKAEVKKKQKLKKMEIEQKLEELKQLTGNDTLAFDKVLDKDFDADEHDKAMQKLFSEEFYSRDDPSFVPKDQEDFEDEWDNEETEDQAHVKEGIDENVEESLNENYEPQCEDPDFNMDCDYDPAAEKVKPKSSRSKRRKDKLRNKNTFSEVLKKEKPEFDPTVHKSFQEYMDQYYAIDCEDFIGDLPCRFKYRRTTPNSYGLTIDEILRADPKELDRWYSIKRLIQLKPAHKEKSEAMSYKNRAKNEALKRKILPSLYKEPEEDQPTQGDIKLEPEVENKTDIKSKVKAIKKEATPSNSNKNDLGKKRKSVPSEMVVPPNKRRKTTPDQGKPNKSHKNKKQEMRQENTKNHSKKNGNQNMSNENTGLLSISDARLQAYGIKPKKFRNKLKYNSIEGDKNKSDSNRGKKKENKSKKSKVTDNDKQNTFTTNNSKGKNSNPNHKKHAGWVVT